MDSSKFMKASLALGAVGSEHLVAASCHSAVARLEPSTVPCRLGHDADLVSDMISPRRSKAIHFEADGLTIHAKPPGFSADFANIAFPLES
jgi:hypothetical protein